jgi:hypothetical protein
LHKGTVNSSLTFAPEGLRLSEAQMVSMERLASTDEARKSGNIAKMPGIPKTLDFTAEQFALVEARGLGCPGWCFFEGVGVRPRRRAQFGGSLNA